jgi:large subunit ribosomal protein L29
MRARELRNLTFEELNSKKSSLKAELFKLQFQRKQGRVERPHRFKEIRRDLARIETVLREKLWERGKKE